MLNVITILNENTTILDLLEEDNLIQELENQNSRLLEL